jgi:hypothetical protein
MTGTPPKGSNGQYIYYRCPHNPGNPRHLATQPDHPRSVQASQNRLDDIVGRFFQDHIFGPRRAALLPASDAEARARRDADATALTARIKQLDTAQNAQITALEEIPAEPGNPAAAAMRARIRDRFAELHDQRQHAETQLAALAAATPKAADPAILNELPYLDDTLPDLPDHLKARLFARSTSPSYGTSHASRQPSTSRSQTPPSRPSPPSSTPARTATTTPTTTPQPPPP